MRNVKKIIIFLLLGVAGTTLADNMLGNAKTPVQLFKSAETSNNVQPASVSQVEQQVLKADAPGVSHEVKPALQMTQQVQALETEINQINQNNLLFQQHANSRAEALSENLESLSKQVKQLGQALVLINEEVLKLTQQKPVVTNRVPMGLGIHHPMAWVKAWQHRLGETTFTLLVVGIVLLLVLMVWLIGPRRRNQRIIAQAEQAQAKSTYDDTKDEYDYMGSHESIPAKLNLARAYLAMEDYAAAKEIIKEILLHGNTAQREEAEGLQKDIGIKQT